MVANTEEEMRSAVEDPLLREKEAVPQELSSILRPLLQRRPMILIVMGYSGNRPAPANAPVPCLMYETLLAKRATWVNHLSFDTFMAALLATAERHYARLAAQPSAKPAAAAIK